MRTTLPEKPIVVLETSGNRTAEILRELVRYRELLLILAMRDVRVRYKQTAFGAAWAIVQPVSAMLIFTVFFGGAANSAAEKHPYPVFVYAGLLPWIFFSNAVTNSGNSLVGNSNLITKIYFPRMIIPLAAVASGLLDFAIAFLGLLILLVYYNVNFSAHLLLLPVLVVLTSVSATGFGLWFSALNVKYRDVRHALPFLIQLGLFASGVAAPIPEKYRFLVYVNPLAAQIEAYRAAFFGEPFDWLALGVSIVLTFGILIYAADNFRRTEETFADII